jgi:hypothetical protein
MPFWGKRFPKISLGGVIFPSFIDDKSEKSVLDRKDIGKVKIFKKLSLTMTIL